MNQNVHNPLPGFDINVENVPSKLEKLLHKNLKQIDELLKQTSFNWGTLMQPLEDMSDELSQMWSPIGHLNAVQNTPELREAYNACLPMLSDYGTKIAHNQKLYATIEAIKNSDEFATLSQAQQKIIENEIRDFKLEGVHLPTKEKESFAKLNKKLSMLTTKFEENILDATQAWTKHITDESQLDGLPDMAKSAAKQAAKARDLDGYLITLEMPSYFAVIAHANSRELRHEIYHAYVTRASDQGPHAGKWDNSTVMEEILATRLAIAKLLEFENYAEKSLATKMVRHTQDVLTFLHKLVDASLPKAKVEFKELAQFAKEHCEIDQLEAWDIAYVSEKLQLERYHISEEDLRPYFPDHKVIDGLFKIVNKLFHIEIKPLENVKTWHPDVKVFALHDHHGKLRANFYFDLFARENKRGGAWMDEFCVRRKLKDERIQIPVAYVTCNFNPPVGDDPALFTHSEVVTLFHEFGHSLQHMLTQIDYADVSGINGVPWDAVELASQFLENWAWERTSIDLIAEHYQTKEPLPDTLYDRMISARNFLSAMTMMRQLEFALFDFELHMSNAAKQAHEIQATLDTVRAAVTVVPVPDFNRFQHGFSHIFAGGYAAGYYSYKWAEVMASDAFSLFKEKGIFDHETSQSFLSTILESGGAKEPLELFVKFRGREPDVQALLRQSGIVK